MSPQYSVLVALIWLTGCCADPSDPEDPNASAEAKQLGTWFDHLRDGDDEKAYRMLRAPHPAEDWDFTLERFTKRVDALGVLRSAQSVEWSQVHYLEQDAQGFPLATTIYKCLSRPPAEMEGELRTAGGTREFSCRTLPSKHGGLDNIMIGGEPLIPHSNDWLEPETPAASQVRDPAKAKPAPKSTAAEAKNAPSPMPPSRTVTPNNAGPNRSPSPGDRKRLSDCFPEQFADVDITERQSFPLEGGGFSFGAYLPAEYRSRSAGIRVYIGRSTEQQLAQRPLLGKVGQTRTEGHVTDIGLMLEGKPALHTKESFSAADGGDRNSLAVRLSDERVVTLNIEHDSGEFDVRTEFGKLDLACLTHAEL